MNATGEHNKETIPIITFKSMEKFRAFIKKKPKHNKISRKDPVNVDPPQVARTDDPPQTDETDQIEDPRFEILPSDPSVSAVAPINNAICERTSNINSNTEMAFFEAVLVGLYSDRLTISEQKDIVSSVIGTVNEEYPPYYDFCVISSEDDYPLAEEFKNELCKTYNLSGCMLHDGFYRLGRDLFDCFEHMMQQSTKIFFFLTENFTVNHFYRRLQSGAVFQSLMSRARQQKEKCVPVYPLGPCYTPLALAGIAGLQPKRKDVLRQSIESTYTEAVRAKRRLCDQRQSEFRLEMYRNILPDMVGKYLSEKQREVDQLSLICTPGLLPSTSVKSVQDQSLPTITSRDNSPLPDIIEPEDITVDSGVSPEPMNVNLAEILSSLKIPKDICRQILKLVSDPTAPLPSDSHPNSVHIGETLDSLPITEETRQILDVLLTKLTVPHECPINVNDCESVQIGAKITVNIYSGWPKNRSMSNSTGNSGSDYEGEDNEQDDLTKL